MTKVTRRAFLAASGAAAALGFSVPAVAAADPVRIGQQPLKLGSDRDGVLFVPKGYKPEVAAPLVLMFHGAGGTGLGVSYTFDVADDLGIIVLAPDSRDEATWDFLVHGYGEDVEFIGAALRDTYARCNVDRKRMAIAGHSDGASYALSLGLGHRRHLRQDHGVLARRDAAGGSARQAEDLHLARPQRSDHADRRHQPEVRAAAESARLRRHVPRV